MTKYRILFLLALFIFHTSGFSTGCVTQQRQPVRYLIPEGYVGWVRIEFRVKEALALPVEDGYYICKFPPNGHVQTSSDIEYGVAKDEYYYYSNSNLRPLAITGWDGGGMIWAGSTGKSTDSNNVVTAIYEHFFVGTEEEYKRYGADYGDHKVGPINKHPSTKEGASPSSP